MTKLNPNYSWFRVSSNDGRIGPFVWCNTARLSWFINSDTYVVLILEPMKVLEKVVLACKSLLNQRLN